MAKETEFTYKEAREIEKKDHDLIYEMYDGVSEATTYGEALEIVTENVVEWLKSLDKDTRIAILMNYLIILNEFSDELGFSF